MAFLLTYRHGTQDKFVANIYCMASILKEKLEQANSRGSIYQMCLMHSLASPSDCPIKMNVYCEQYARLISLEVMVGLCNLFDEFKCVCLCV